MQWNSAENHSNGNAEIGESMLKVKSERIIHNEHNKENKAQYGT